MIVADTNLIVYLFITRPNIFGAEVLEKDPHWIVPPLWQSEFRNVLIAGYIRRGMKIGASQRKIMKDAMLTLENRQVTPSSEKIFDLISESDCTA
ncbi:MAG: hypothetical protein U0V48_13855 [Anaerolineales bacterium]